MEEYSSHHRGLKGLIFGLKLYSLVKVYWSCLGFEALLIKVSQSHVLNFKTEPQVRATSTALPCRLVLAAHIVMVQSLWALPIAG